MSFNLSGDEGTAYITRLLFKETAYMRRIADQLGDNKDDLKKTGLEIADNIEYLACCLKTLDNGETIDHFSPPYPEHMDVEDYRDN